MDDNQIDRARTMREEGMTYRAIALAIAVSPSTVHVALNESSAEKKRVYAANHRDEMAAYRAAHKEEAAVYCVAHREEKAAYGAAYRAAHKEEIVAYRTEHKEERAAYDAAYRATHKKERAVYDAAHYAEHKEKSAAYYAAHKEERAAYRVAHKEERVAYLVAHKEEIAARRVMYDAAYYLAHRDEYAARSAARRALIAGATVGDRAEITEIYRRAEEDEPIRCYLCGDLIPLGDREVDHVIPVKPKDKTIEPGKHAAFNLRIVHSRCNSRKSNKMLEELDWVIGA